MTSILLRIGIAAVLSMASLTVVLLRVSPLTTPGIAIPFFFATMFLSVAALGTLLFYAIWNAVQIEGLDAGKKISIALREGVFLGLGTGIVFVLQILGVLTWWIGILVYLVFFLVEMALQS